MGCGDPFAISTADGVVNGSIGLAGLDQSSRFNIVHGDVIPGEEGQIPHQEGPGGVGDELAPEHDPYSLLCWFEPGRCRHPSLLSDERFGFHLNLPAGVDHSDDHNHGRGGADVSEHLTIGSSPMSDSTSL
jgi:hypothetical protein